MTPLLHQSKHLKVRSKVENFLPRRVASCVRRSGACNSVYLPVQDSASPIKTSQKNGTNNASPLGRALPSPCRYTGIIGTVGLRAAVAGGRHLVALQRNLRQDTFRSTDGFSAEPLP